MNHDMPRPAFRFIAGNATRRRAQLGLTLVEVLLVLALLVVIGAVSAPMLEGSFSRAALQNGGDLLRAAWSKARLAALESGESCVFRFEPHGSRYQMVKLVDLGSAEAETLEAETSGADHPAVDMLRLGKYRLPDGVTFAGADIVTSNQVVATIGDTSGGPWSEPIVFHPDGTTTDASVLLANERHQTIRVTLRGLTGISHAGDVGSEKSP
jgi:Tfp pilus assembly protein FimT